MNEHNPVSHVRWVPIEKVRANDYNPNAIASIELKLLYLSIKHDGYTMPIVCMKSGDGQFVIIDGFHRYSIMKRYSDIHDANSGHLPIVVIDKDINNRMASTIRHNRARGRHSIDGMGKIVIDMLNGGWTDARVCEELGLEKEELARLKHVTGYAKFFEGAEYSHAMETDKQIEERLKYQASVKEAAGPKKKSKK